MDDLVSRAEAFRALHERPGAFIIPNPWDAGSARILAGLGFEALATTSAGFACSRGRRDGAMTRDEVLAHCRDICAAVSLPVSADLENGFGDAPEDAAKTIGMAGETGLVGGSIEDWSGTAIYPFDHAVERVAAAVEAARALPFPFVLTARAENLLRGVHDLDDTIRRLQAYEAAGADVLYAPALPDLDAVRAVCGAVSRPVNVLAAGPLVEAGAEALGRAGAARISLGSGLSNAAFGALIAMAEAMRDRGSFDFLARAPSGQRIRGFMAE